MNENMNEELLRSLIKDFITKLEALLRDVIPEEGVLPEDNYKGDRLSKRSLAELISHEGIVKEAYKDSKGIWTWGIGVTNASGHNVMRYKNNPQPLSKVFDIFDWLVRTKYLPAVEAAFTGPLTEAQVAAALSFHYNTGAIGRASWVKSFNAGNIEKARNEIMSWRSPKEIIPRRTKERDLFFDGKWSSNGTALVYQGVSGSYQPRNPKRVDISEELDKWAS